jgi:hypothetical protein
MVNHDLGHSFLIHPSWQQIPHTREKLKSSGDKATLSHYELLFLQKSNVHLTEKFVLSTMIPLKPSTAALKDRH